MPPEKLFLPGYHLTAFPKGEFGELSKIEEEIREYQDALGQGVAIMALVELSDLYGAIQGYLAKHHPTLTVETLGCGSVAANDPMRELKLLVKSMKEHLTTRHPSLGMRDLSAMSAVTQRAFRNGHRV